MSQETPYQTIAAPIRFEMEPVKGSRFIGDAFPASTAEAAQEALLSVRQEFSNATHHCWAYRLREQEQERSSDDGEPGGSAGRPILAQIVGHALEDVLVVVTRYYGGTKLGVGGLVRAYGGAAGKTLDRAELRQVVPKKELWLNYAYDDTNRIQAALNVLQLAPQRSEYGARVESLLMVPYGDWEEVRQELINQTAGRVEFRESSPS